MNLNYIERFNKLYFFYLKLLIIDPEINGSKAVTYMYQITFNFISIIDYYSLITVINWKY